MRLGIFTSLNKRRTQIITCVYIILIYIHLGTHVHRIPFNIRFAVILSLTRGVIIVIALYIINGITRKYYIIGYLDVGYLGEFPKMGENHILSISCPLDANAAPKMGATRVDIPRKLEIWPIGRKIAPFSTSLLGRGAQWGSPESSGPEIENPSNRSEM